MPAPGSFAQKHALPTARVINSFSEMEAYGRLRYKVWKSEGHLPESSDPVDSGIELNFSDYFSIPVGLFDSFNNLVGCGRLVQEVMNDRGVPFELVNNIRKHYRDPILRRNLAETPYAPQFDVLAYFPSFLEIYRKLVFSKAKKAEISRIIVAPEHRGNKYSGLIVEELIAIARDRSFDCVFLACRPELEGIYAQQGFVRIPQVNAEEFGDIKVPSIAMHLALTNKGVIQ